VSNFKVNDSVRYHPVIGGPHDGVIYPVLDTGILPSGHPVVWLGGKSGCVSEDAVSHVEQVDLDNFPGKWEGGAE
jgi:hypothetical protein